MSVERTFGAFITGIETASEKVYHMLEKLFLEIKSKNKYNLITGVFVKIKFSDLSVTTVGKTGLLPTFKNFFCLLEEGVKRNPNPIRLIDLGVRLNPVIKKSRQIDFIEVLDQ